MIRERWLARLQIALALRPGEARRLQFGWLDEANQTVTLPITKNGLPFTAPINDVARAVIDRCHELRSCDHLFAGPDGHRPIGESMVYRLIYRLTNGASAHAVARSCFADWAYENQMASDATIESALNHLVGSEVVRAYKRGDMLEARRKLGAAWSDFVLGITASNIVQFPKAAAAQ